MNKKTAMMTTALAAVLTGTGPLARADIFWHAGDSGSLTDTVEGRWRDSSATGTATNAPTAADTVRIGDGTVTLSAGERFSAAALGVEFGGASDFTMSGGELTISGETLIGRWGKGFTRLTDGMWKSGTLMMANRAPTNAVFTISGGTFWLTSSGESRIGYESDNSSCVSPAELNISGGTLLATNGEFKIGNGRYGNAETGLVNQTGGTVSLRRLDIGGGSTAAGFYTITGGTLNLVKGSYGHCIGDSASSYGELNISGDAVVSFDWSGSSFQVGSQWGGSGVVNQSGGSFHFLTGDLALGVAATAIGTYTLAGGALALDSGSVYVGYSGTGRLSVTEGTLTTGGSMTVGYAATATGSVLQVGGAVGITNASSGDLTLANAEGGFGEYILSGGTLTVGRNLTVANGTNRTGVLTINGGTAEIGTQIYMNGHSTINLNGGTLSLINIHPYRGKSGRNGLTAVNCNGGTLRSSTGNSWFIEGVEQFNILEGGLTVDVNNGNSRVLDTDFLSAAEADGGVTKTGTNQLEITSACTVGWNGATRVEAGTLYFGGHTLAMPIAIAQGAAIKNATFATHDLTAIGDWTNTFSLAAYNNSSTIFDGSLTIEGGNVLLAKATASVTNLVLQGGAALDLNAGNLSAGGLTGSGTITNGTLTVAGRILPDGKLTVPGNAALSGTLAVTVKEGGAVSGTLAATGPIDLSALSLVIAGAEHLAPDAVYSIVAAKGFSGRFQTVTGLPMPWVVHYDTSTGTVTIEKAHGTVFILGGE